VAAGLAITAKQGGETRFLNGDLLDFQTRDLTALIGGTYITGHPDVVRRLLPLVTPRAEQIQHPAW